MKNNLILLYVLVALSMLIITPQAQAATVDTGPWPIDVLAIICRIIDLLWLIFVGLVIIMFIWAGILYLIAKGDPGKIQTANKVLIWATVGVAVGILAFSAYTIVNWFIYGNLGNNFVCPP